MENNFKAEENKVTSEEITSFIFLSNFSSATGITPLRTVSKAPL